MTKKIIFVVSVFLLVLMVSCASTDGKVKEVSESNTLSEASNDQNRQWQSVKILVYAEVPGVLQVNEKKDGFKAIVNGTVRTNPININSSITTLLLEVDGYTGDEIKISVFGQDWRYYDAAEVITLQKDIINYVATITSTSASIKRNQIYIQLTSDVTGSLKVSGVNEAYVSNMPNNVTAGKSVSFTMHRMNGEKFRAGTNFAFYVEDEQGNIYETLNPFIVRSDNYIQYQVIINPNQSTNTNFIAQTQSIKTYQDAHGHFIAGSYNEAIVEYQKALDTGGLNNNQTKLAQEYIDWSRRILSSRESAKNLRDEDFGVRQNSDNTITITSFNRPSPIQNITFNGRQYNIISGITELVIPSRLYGLDVTVIGSNVFKERGLISVVIPNTVIEIGEGAFESNDKLNKVTIGNRVRTIGKNAFRDSRELKEISIPNSVIQIGQGAFSLSEFDTRYIQTDYGEIKTQQVKRARSVIIGLTSVTLGNGVQTIGAHAFVNNSISNITLGNSIKTVGEYAFGNNLLTSVTLPASLTEIGPAAFQNNPIQSVTIRNANIEFISSSLGRMRGTPSGGIFNSDLSRITLPANMGSDVLRGFSFSPDIINFYTSQNRAAGTYVKNGPIWTRQ